MTERQVEGRRRRRRRGSLTRELIVDAAFTLAEERGLAAFTMPDLAAQLDVGVTGLYWHFKTKDELLRAMGAPAMTRLDALMVQPGGADPRQWRPLLRRYFHRLRTAYAEYPVLADIMLMHPSALDAKAVLIGYQAMDKLIVHLTAAGFTAVQAWHLYSTALLFTQSTVIAERARTQYGDPPSPPGDVGEEQEWSALAELAADGRVNLDMTGDEAFGAGLELILAGAEHQQRLHQQDPSTSG